MQTAPPLCQAPAPPSQAPDFDSPINLQIERELEAKREAAYSAPLIWQDRQLKDWSIMPCPSSFRNVRPTPKRMPLRGDRISLRAWSDKPYRSPQRILREAVISEVVKIRIETGRIWVAGQSHITKYPQRSSDQTLDSFAMADGFESWDAMKAWFEDQHGLPFEGVLIQWTNAGAMTRGASEMPEK